ncbi:MAG TPA: hypothetical protein VKI44_02755 [Acetobacteraceae bacterium]|nr:hypothetical protein [Acetobacteraceae bacterium]
MNTQWRGATAKYRFHLLDRNGYVMTVKEHTCADDAAALMAATHLLAGCSGVEVWHGNKRIVARVPKLSSSPASTSDVRSSVNAEFQKIGVH